MKSEQGAASDRGANAPDRGDTVKMVVTVASALVAALSCFLAWQSFRASQRVAAVSVYMQLREEFGTLREQIPEEYFINRNHAVPPGRSEAWGRISDYWHLSFDEWYITTHLGDPLLQKLWQERYQYLIAPQLENKAFRGVLCFLVKEKFHTPLQREFVEELEAQYRARTKSEAGLCPGEANGK
ncbi:MAG: hypothetical protein ACOY8P_09285 [Thermodesulfobacteriota bacterium]